MAPLPLLNNWIRKFKITLEIPPTYRTNCPLALAIKHVTKDIDCSGLIIELCAKDDRQKKSRSG